MSDGAVNWEVAREVAAAVSSGGAPDTEAHDVAPFEAIVRAAEMRLDAAGALSRGTDVVKVRALSRRDWAADAMEGLRPLIERLATRLGSIGSGFGGAVVASGLEGQGEESEMGTAFQQAIEAFMKPMAPIFMGMQMGWIFGFVSSQALSQYDLFLPRTEPGVASFIGRNVDEAAHAIGVDPDEMRMWVAMHELVHLSQLSLAWTRERLNSLLEAYIDSIQFSMDMTALQEHLKNLDPQDPESVRRAVDSTEGLLGKFMSTDQPDVLDSVQTFISALEGYADHVVGIAATGMLSGASAIAEGLGRRRAEAGDADRPLEGLLGLSMTSERLDEGRLFCSAVTARTDIATLNRMWESLETFPTREELRTPEEWIARIARTPHGGMFTDSE